MRISPSRGKRGSRAESVDWERTWRKECVLGSKLPRFPYKRGWLSTQIVRVYIPKIIRIPVIKGGMTILNIRS